MLILLAGIVLPQCVLEGPSLVGRKLFLALDVLAHRQVYLPMVHGRPPVPPGDFSLSDPVLQFEPFRWFTISELRAGRMPLWNPYEYCGAPYLAANQPAIFSPIRLLDYVWPSPRALAWRQMLKALIAGLGAYLFFRRAMQVEFAPAVVGAWVWPLCGFFVLWAGHPQSEEAIWLPWAMAAIDWAVRRPAGLGTVAVAASAACLLVSGHSATGGQILLGCGVYFLWRVTEFHGVRNLLSRGAFASVAAVVCGWVAGFMLAAPQMLPTLEYMSASHRIAARVAGPSETPAIGIAAVPQLFFPFIYGSTADGAINLGDAGLQESAATGAVGVFVGLLLAPLALANRRRRWLAIACWVAAGAAMGQILGIPLLSTLLESPPLNHFRNNRLVLLSGWAILMAAVVGCEFLVHLRARPPRWVWLAAIPASAAAIWCLNLFASPPALLTETLDQARTALRIGRHPAPPLGDLESIDRVGRWFHATYAWSAGFCVMALALCVGLLLWPQRRRLIWVAGGLAVFELTILAYGFYPQCDPALYYPDIAVLSALAKAPPGRICGMNCLPPRLGERFKLSDIRGYDGADPQRLVDVLNLFRDEESADAPDYAVTQSFMPRPSPLANMLSLRYLIYRGAPRVKSWAMLAGDDYYVVENKDALPRVLVPRSAEVVNDSTLRLSRLADPAFDARQTLLVESNDPVPPHCDGDATLASEDPTHVQIDFNLRTPGVVFLADLWDPGWRAYLNGASLPVLRGNHAFRAVCLPRGAGRLEFRYEPASYFLGLKLCLAAAAALAAWSGIAHRHVLARTVRKSPPRSVI